MQNRQLQIHSFRFQLDPQPRGSVTLFNVLLGLNTSKHKLSPHHLHFPQMKMSSLHHHPQAPYSSHFFTVNRPPGLLHIKEQRSILAHLRIPGQKPICNPAKERVSVRTCPLSICEQTHTEEKSNQYPRGNTSVRLVLHKQVGKSIWEKDLLTELAVRTITRKGGP